jgi:hypothetical protein
LTIRYENIVEVILLHEYNGNNAYSGLGIYPTIHTSSLLGTLGWLFRSTRQGFKIFARINPGTIPPQLFITGQLKSLKLTFYLTLASPEFLNYTELPSINLGHEIFYFNNLRKELMNGTNLLGDNIDNARIGNAIELLTNNVAIHDFSVPVNSASLTINDIFNNNYQFEGQQFTLPGPTDKIGEYSIDLYKISPFPYGRYSINDNLGGKQPCYYDPSLFGKQVFGIIELFSNTLDFTNPSTDQVPAEYQFLNVDRITGKGTYAVLFPGRTVKWKYVIRKKPEVQNGINLNNLSLSGDIVFPASPAMTDGNAVFQSVNTVTSRLTPYNIILNHAGSPLFKLPNPAQSLQSQQQNNDYFYEMNIYV